MRKLFLLIGSLMAFALVALYAIGLGWFGDVITAGSAEGGARSNASIEERVRRVSEGVERLGAEASGSILFGDLHVHSGFSSPTPAISPVIARHSISGRSMTTPSA